MALTPSGFALRNRRGGLPKSGRLDGADLCARYIWCAFSCTPYIVEAFITGGGIHKSNDYRVLRDYSKVRPSFGWLAHPLTISILNILNKLPNFGANSSKTALAAMLVLGLQVATNYIFGNGLGTPVLLHPLSISLPEEAAKRQEGQKPGSVSPYEGKFRKCVATPRKTWTLLVSRYQ